jgi:hypothetical protein
VRRLGSAPEKSKTTNAWHAYPAKGSRVLSRECTWMTHGGNPLRRTSRGHHTRDRRGKC